MQSQVIEHTVLLVDDEKSITNSLRRLFRKESFTLLSAAGGEEGLELLKGLDKSVSLIISDQRMPNMTGSEFLEQARNITPHAIRFLLTGYSDLDAVVEAVNKGQIHRYLTKPWDDRELVLAVRQALAQFELVAENRRLFALTHLQNRQLEDWNTKLEERVAQRTRELARINRKLAELADELEAGLWNTVRAFSSLLKTLSPGLAGHSRRVSEGARETALALGLSPEEIVRVEIAALLHDLGMAGHFEKFVSGDDTGWDAQELASYKRHPVEGQTVVGFIPRLEEVGRVIRHHHEQFDGKGFPDGLSGEGIPIGARIIAVADAHDWIACVRANSTPYMREFLSDTGGDPAGNPLDLTARAALHHVKKNAGIRFDPVVAEAFLAVLGKNAPEPDSERAVAPKDLKEGMVLSRPLYSGAGVFLLPRDTVLGQGAIEKLRGLMAQGSLAGAVHVAALEAGCSPSGRRAAPGRG
jgi:response regulator RpfG family c-di-GMP phosphodiesterase